MKKRAAAVEGRFYPSTKSKIRAQISRIDSEARYSPEPIEFRQIFGAVLPHAGHIFSGHQTVPFFKLLQKFDIHPETFIIVHPNHRGGFAPIAIDDSDIWVNAIGEVPIDREFASAMDLPFDIMARSGEHSAEVIVPFIQYYFPDYPFRIVAVCMRDQGHESARLVSESIQGAVKKTGRDIMVLASCDFSHFLPPALGVKRDQKVLDEILSRNAPEVEQAVKKHDLSVCGYGPVMTLMNYSSSIEKAYNVRIMARGHSGEVIDSDEVVDYISILMYR